MLVISAKFFLSFGFLYAREKQTLNNSPIHDKGAVETVAAALL